MELLSQGQLVVPLAGELFQCVFLIGVGYACRRFVLLSPSDAAGLSAFVARISLPALLFLSMVELDVMATEWQLLLATATSKVLVFSGTVALCCIAAVARRNAHRLHAISPRLLPAPPPLQAVPPEVVLPAPLAEAEVTGVGGSLEEQYDSRNGSARDLSDEAEVRRPASASVPPGSGRRGRLAQNLSWSSDVGGGTPTSAAAAAATAAARPAAAREGGSGSCRRYAPVKVSSGFVPLASASAASDSWMCTAGLYAIASTQSNDYALGVPLISALWGDQYLPIVYLLAPLQLALLNPLGFALIEWGRTPGGADRRARRRRGLSVLRRVLRSPLVLSVGGGLALKALQMVAGWDRALPHVVMEVLAKLRDAFAATALVTLGLSLKARLSVMSAMPLTTLALLASKLLLMPLLMRLVAELFTVSSRDSLNFAFLYGMLPSAPTVVVFAREYGQPSEFLAALQLVGLIISVPFLLVSTVAIELPAVSPSSASRLLRASSIAAAIVSFVGSGCYLLQAALERWQRGGLLAARPKRLPVAGGAIAAPPPPPPTPPQPAPPLLVPAGPQTPSLRASLSLPRKRNSTLLRYLGTLSATALLLAAATLTAHAIGPDADAACGVHSAARVPAAICTWCVYSMRGQAAGLALLMAQQACPERSARSTPDAQRASHAALVGITSSLAATALLLDWLLIGVSIPSSRAWMGGVFSCAITSSAARLLLLTLDSLYFIAITMALVVVRLAPSPPAPASGSAPAAAAACAASHSPLPGATPYSPAAAAASAGKRAMRVRTADDESARAALWPADAVDSVAGSSAGSASTQQQSPLPQLDESSANAGHACIGPDVAADISSASAVEVLRPAAVSAGNTTNDSTDSQQSMLLQQPLLNTAQTGSRSERVPSTDEAGAAACTGCLASGGDEAGSELPLCEALEQRRLRLSVLLLYVLLSMLLSLSIKVAALTHDAVSSGVELEVELIAQLVDASVGSLLAVMFARVPPLLIRALVFLRGLLGLCLAGPHDASGRAFPGTWTAMPRSDSTISLPSFYRCATSRSFRRDGVTADGSATQSFA